MLVKHDVNSSFAIKPETSHLLSKTKANAPTNKQKSMSVSKSSILEEGTVTIPTTQGTGIAKLFHLAANSIKVADCCSSSPGARIRGG